MRFGKKLLAAIERGEWVRLRSWPKGLKIRKGDDGRFVDEEGLIGGVVATEVLAKDWVIVRKKSKAPKAPVADDPATVEGDPEGGCLAEGWPTIIEGLAHLKNTNPTVIAMLKAAIEGLKELRTHHLAGMSDPVWGAPYHKYRLRAIDQIVAHLNTLAQEALGTTGELDRAEVGELTP